MVLVTANANHIGEGMLHSRHYPSLSEHLRFVQTIAGSLVNESYEINQQLVLRKGLEKASR